MPKHLVGATLTFAELGDFNAYRAACTHLRAQGFSVGRMQGPDPVGLLFGGYDIQKWRNLRPAERVALHGTLEGDKRNGPITVRIKTAMELAVLGLASHPARVEGRE
jgi:hypothetical protein